MVQQRQPQMVWRAAMVRVLELDPDLASVVDARERSAAIAAAVAPVFELDQGPWQFFPKVERGALGALIFGGLGVIRVGGGTRSHVELLGEGDLISPWVGTGSELNVPSDVSAEIVSEMRVALLDRRFVVRTAHWPEVQAALFHRLVTRSRRLSLQSAINAVPRIDERLELTLWHLGDRFGRVSADGVVLGLPLTHSLLAELIGAHRPSVTIALQKLEAAGRLTRKARRRWVLCGDPPTPFPRLARQTGLRR
jgi:CRP-like cAMP-binding protein